MLALFITCVVLVVISCVLAVFKEKCNENVHVQQYEHLIKCAYLTGKSDEEIQYMKGQLVKIKKQYKLA